MQSNRRTLTAAHMAHTDSGRVPWPVGSLCDVSGLVAGPLESETGQVFPREGAESGYTCTDHGEIYFDNSPKPDVVSVP